jgi:hypothetical protein
MTPLILILLIGILEGGVQLGPLGLRPPMVYCASRAFMMEKLVEWSAVKTEVLGENLPQRRFVHHKPHKLPGRVPGPPRWEASV